jgi:DNA polymerase III sliding clamp (beta) subunit (PCNA family)
MDIRVSKLREILTLLKPVVPRKATLDVITYIYLGDGQAVGTDLETMVITPVPEADTPMLLPYADVLNMLQFVQGGESLHLENKDGKLLMVWSDGKTSLNTKDAKDFPVLSEFVPAAEAQLDADILIPAMVSILPYAATEVDRPVLNGVTLEMGETFQIAAGDGFRMAYQVLPLSFPKNITAIVPMSAVRILQHLCEKTPRTPPASDDLIPVIMAKRQISVAYSDKVGDTRMRFIFGKAATAVVKLVAGNPPAFVKLIPKDTPILQSQFMAADLQLAVRRALKVALDGSKIIRMSFNDSTATISAAGDDQNIESTIRTLSIKGEPNKVALNAEYLLDYLKGKEGVITMAMTSREAPVMFQHQKGPRVLIMPMFVKEDSPAPAPEPPAAEVAAPDPEKPPEDALPAPPDISQEKVEPAPGPEKEEEPAKPSKTKPKKKKA